MSMDQGLCNQLHHMGLDFAASENTDAPDRSPDAFFPAHPWVADASGQRGAGGRLRGPQRRFSGPEGSAAEKVMGGPSRSCWQPSARASRCKRL